MVTPQFLSSMPSVSPTLLTKENNTKPAQNWTHANSKTLELGEEMVPYLQTKESYVTISEALNHPNPAATDTSLENSMQTLLDNGCDEETFSDMFTVSAEYEQKDKQKVRHAVKQKCKNEKA